MSCCKEHNNDNCSAKDSYSKNHDDQKNEEKEKEIEISTGIPKDKLQLLGKKILNHSEKSFLRPVTISETDKELNNLLANKHLRDLLMVIDKAEDAEKIMQEAMQEPIFVEFADACLRIVDPQSDNED